MKKEDIFTITHSGVKFNPFTVTEKDILIEDIAHALSMQCRFAGHTKKFYSVAQHSVLVHDNCPDEFKAWGLLHDATEAYLCDIPRPFKKLPDFDFYNEMEENLMAVIAKKFGLKGVSVPREVKDHDVRALFTEKRDLIANDVDWNWDIEPIPYDEIIDPYQPLTAELLFLDRFKKLGLL